MKIVSNERTADYYSNIKMAALQGAAFGGIISLGLRSFIKYRNPNFFLKAGGYHRGLIYAGPAAFCAMTNMERMSTSYENNRRKAEEAQRKGEILPETKERTWGDFFVDYKYQTIVAGWLAAMGGSFYAVNRSPFMTKSQKIVQARVYAQGLTVLMLLASVFLSVGSHDSNVATKERINHSSRSWERDLDFVAAANRPKSA